MEPLFYILISTFLISLIAFSGAVILFLKEELLNKILLILVSFAAGALIGSSFFHLIPEAIEEVGFEEEATLKMFLFLLLGFCTFFILENFLQWHHHHSKDHPEIKSFSYLILISDAVHNFIDGLIIAASFIISFSVGTATFLAVAFHEIPRQLGNFGLLIYSGFKKLKALFLNFSSSLAVVCGGIAGFFISDKINDYLVYFLPFAAGSFIYIACSDLIPEIKHKVSPQKALIHFFVFLAGIAIMFLLKSL